MAGIFKLVVIVIALMLPALAFATAQAPDRLRIDGEDHALNTNPLDAHLASIGWTVPEGVIVSSANWRGHIAYWEIAGDRLVLTDVTIMVSGDGPQGYVLKSLMAELFPSTQGPVVADWYSGALIVPEGEITDYVHMGYESTYERYRLLRVAAGKVVEHLHLSAEEFAQYKAAKFEAFTATDEFREALDALRERTTGPTEEQLLESMKQAHAERYLGL